MSQENCTQESNVFSFITYLDKGSFIEQVVTLTVFLILFLVALTQQVSEINKRISNENAKRKQRRPLFKEGGRLHRNIRSLALGTCLLVVIASSMKIAAKPSIHPLYGARRMLDDLSVVYVVGMAICLLNCLQDVLMRAHRSPEKKFAIMETVYTILFVLPQLLMVAGHIIAWVTNNELGLRSCQVFGTTCAYIIVATMVWFCYQYVSLIVTSSVGFPWKFVVTMTLGICVTLVITSIFLQSAISDVVKCQGITGCAYWKPCDYDKFDEIGALTHVGASVITTLLLVYTWSWPVFLQVPLVGAEPSTRRTTSGVLKSLTIVQ